MARLADLKIRSIADMTDTEVMSFMLEVRARRRTRSEAPAKINKLEKRVSKLNTNDMRKLLELMRASLQKGT
jgi:hypothetical protein